MGLQNLYMAGSQNYVKKIFMWEEDQVKFIDQGTTWTGGATGGFIQESIYD
jgi:hypothetical protein